MKLVTAGVINVSQLIYDTDRDKVEQIRNYTSDVTNEDGQVTMSAYYNEICKIYRTSDAI